MISPADRIRQRALIFDGGLGTLLQAQGLPGGELPERWNLTHRDVIRAVHLSYLRAGAEVLNMNTFGANRLHFPEGPAEVIRAAAALAKEARKVAGREEDAYIALDIGPTGKLLKPYGDLAFEDAVGIFAEVVREGAAAGADLVLIETMSDLYEAKAALLAAKENCSLPVFVTCTFDRTGRLLTGADAETVVTVLEGLGADALGVNCSLGPADMLPIVRTLCACASVPVIVNPNAGLPSAEGGRTVYDVGPDAFAAAMGRIARMGARGLGGCCGTTPAHIRKLRETVYGLLETGVLREGAPTSPRASSAAVTSWARTHRIGGQVPVSGDTDAPDDADLLLPPDGDGPAAPAVSAAPPLTVIGERINPTGKKRFRKALIDHDIDYILNQALQQEAAGAHILDVNVGTPEIDEAAMMAELIPALQAVTDLPLAIDTSDAKALETALRLYNGKALVNSVNGKRASMETVFPLVKKYGGAVIALCLDEQGIPETSAGRAAVAEKILDTAASYGIPRQDILFDALTMAVSADPGAARTTLDAVRYIHDVLGGNTVLGVSNVSFGLPNRALLNAQFLSMAMRDGLSAAILNPNDGFMTDAVRASDALLGKDAHFARYTEAYRDLKSVGAREASLMAGTPGVPAAPSAPSAAPESPAPNAPDAPPAGGDSGFAALGDCIERGLVGKAAGVTRTLLASGEDPFALISDALVPALDTVGKGFEKGTVFLPQLLISADAAKAAFSVIRDAMKTEDRPSKGRILLATVQGDIHDIGKNIVKVMLENYGYDVLDLGKDVPPEKIADAAVSEQIRLVGLSALMTTTVGAMEATIRLLRARKPDTKVIVGGAVMTESYAAAIGADAYGKDAMATVRYADSVFT